MNKKLLPLIIILVLSAFVYIFTHFVITPKKEKFIVVNPLNIAQIAQVSKFRSCVGHDYSGYNEDEELEKNRSMKHYITPKSEFLNSSNSVIIYSPFDGLVTNIEEESSREGVQVSISPKTSQSYRFIFFHVRLLDGITKNSEVTAGQQIGFAMLEEYNNFDIALKKFISDNDFQILESPFEHMTPSVLSEYTQKGLEIEDLIISKEDRDKLSCEFGIGSGQEEWVTLE
ncbi:MAG: hypothetical protein ABIC57_02560 [bacterium]